MLLTRSRPLAAAVVALFFLALPLLVHKLVTMPLILAPIAGLVAGLLILRRIDWIGYAVAIIAFTRADAWLTARTGLPFGSLTGALVAAAFLTVMLFSIRKLTAPNAAFGYLFLFYATATLTGVFSGNWQHSTAWLRDAMAAFLTFGTVYCFVSGEDMLRRLTHLIVLCGIVVSLVNLAELLNPGQINLSHSEGRSAGLLKNANVSAFVIVCCFVVHQMSRYRRGRRNRIRWRTVAVQVLMICGVMSTFSRSGMLTLAMATAGSIFIDVRNRRSPAELLTALGLTVAITVAVLRYMLDTTDIAVLYSLKRITTFLSGEVDDNYRFFLAKYYFTKFLEQPLTGFGFNATVSPSGANMDLQSVFGIKGPHNTFVGILTEFGLAAAAVYSLFLVSVLRGLRFIADTRLRAYLCLLFGIVCVYHIFIHNMYLSRPAMTLFALLALAAAVLPKRNNGLKSAPQLPITNGNSNQITKKGNTL
jgi:hypothetical protein